MRSLLRSAATLVFLPVFRGVGSVHAQGVPGVAPNKCVAGKNKCVNAKVRGLLKCREKCQKKPDKCGQAQTDCETKVMDKFDGGADATKGGFAKLEAKDNPAKPDSVCTTTGDSGDIEAEVDGVVAEILGRLEGAPAPTCGDGVVNQVSEQCDGSDLDGLSCASFGSLGTLDCDPSCQLDGSGCGGCGDLGGAEFGGACWFYAAANTGCDTACVSVGLEYDDATRTVAGSAGTGQNCLDVMAALGESLPTGNLNAMCLAALGCVNNVGSPAPTTNRCANPATTAAAGPGSGSRRACACH